MDGHGVYLKSHNIDICEVTPIYRYTDLYSVLNILYYNKFYVSNIQSFSDLTERCDKKTVLDEIVRAEPTIKQLFGKSIHLFFHFQAVPNEWQRKQIKAENSARKRVCASCWTLDRRVTGALGESLLMWKAYSNSELSCRIGTTIGKFIDSIKHLPCDIVISDVDYTQTCSMNEYERRYFRKKPFYDQEQEVRMLFLANRKNGITINVNAKDSIDEITISPFITPRIASMIKIGLGDLCQELGINLHYSLLEEYKLSDSEKKENEAVQLQREYNIINKQ